MGVLWVLLADGRQLAAVQPLHQPSSGRAGQGHLGAHPRRRRPHRSNSSHEPLRPVTSAGLLRTTRRTGPVASAGTRGDSSGNAVAEAFDPQFKAELVRYRHKGPWRDIDDRETAVAEYVDWFGPPPRPRRDRLRPARRIRNPTRDGRTHTTDHRRPRRRQISTIYKSRGDSPRARIQHHSQAPAIRYSSLTTPTRVTTGLRILIHFMELRQAPTPNPPRATS